MLQKKIADRITRAIDEGVFPACVVGSLTPDAGRNIQAFGRHTCENTAQKANEDSIFDVASITKAIPTSCLGLLLVQKGKLGIDDRVLTYIPELAFSDRGDVRVRHLLTHTLNYNFRLSSFKDMGPQAILTAVFSTELFPDRARHFFTPTPQAFFSASLSREYTVSVWR